MYATLHQVLTRAFCLSNVIGGQALTTQTKAWQPLALE